MKRATAVAAGAVVLVAAAAMGASGADEPPECHPWRGDYLGTFRQEAGPGTDSTVTLSDSEAADGTATTLDSPYRATGSGTWRVTEDGHVVWRLDGVNRLGTGAEVDWSPTYTATAFECDARGRVVRITGDGIDTAPFPSRFDFVRVAPAEPPEPG
ncbi:hypothetical protein LX16_1742 [Stackebrandtia albiflava]|uniref:Secreted protein n=1 Tax=Stackebrandtia albiflava TaxID=406432 RepID=A0A562VDT9_9ACTN|nr:hypothetical protein [Stackebrandtia albiflava]TWJ16022.1 hypothetical protein LX16_1742 [Stackebrandtia albiflava]